MISWFIILIKITYDNASRRDSLFYINYKLKKQHLSQNSRNGRRLLVASNVYIALVITRGKHNQNGKI